MGIPHAHPPTLLLMAAFSRYAEALEWARRRAEERFGPIALASPLFDFDQTDYYNADMGTSLKKCFWAFADRFDPQQLAEAKHETNRWEAEYADFGRHPEPRPLNLDPGYLTLGKLVLASTKDFAHRIYLRDGIYAEVTLFYRRHQWEHHQFTFADYRRADYQAFFSKCRDWLHELSRAGPRAS